MGSGILGPTHNAKHSVKNYMEKNFFDYLEQGGCFWVVLVVGVFVITLWECYVIQK